MHSVIFALAAISGLASAGATVKAQTECKGVGDYYVCGANGFRGWCSNDPCAKEWCSDFEYKTCNPSLVTKPVDGSTEHEHEPEHEHGGHWEPEEHKPEEHKPEKKLPEGQCAPNTGYYQVCSNGFKGCCKSDACTGTSWCSDYKTGTYELKHSKRNDDPTVCAPGTGFFQSCSNGFKGCCKSDACSGKSPVCPDYKIAASKRNDDPTVCPEGTGFFQSCSNGFRGCCKSDACAGTSPICPDYKTSAAKRSDDPTVCAPGTGFFQSCSNGFRGCCKSDACSGNSPVCPDNKQAKRNDDPTVCPEGTGFFQSCSNGFRGCCKGDACGNSWCPDYQFGTYKPAQTLQVKTRAAGTCRPNTGYYQVCSNGFKGCCKKDACGQKSPICPK